LRRNQPQDQILLDVPATTMCLRGGRRSFALFKSFIVFYIENSAQSQLWPMCPVNGFQTQPESYSIFAAEISSPSTDDALIRGSDRTYHCTDFNVGHGRLQVESFCRFSVPLPCHVTSTTTLFTPRFPVGILIPAPGHCFVSHACLRVLSFSALVDLSAF
jgi:hypothetical protein